MSALVLVAHESEAIRQVIVTLLRDARYGVREAEDGGSCRAVLEGGGVGALVLDVSIADPFAFELIEVARQRGVRVILVASIYNRTSYKRRPTQLYGADDYIEQHHVPDSLVAKVAKLVGDPPPKAVDPKDEEARVEQVRVAAEAQLADPSANPGGRDAVQRAERLARLIVSDIALYNGDAIIAARHAAGQSRHGQPYDELEARLRVDLEEGRLLFDLRVPQVVRKQRDFIGDALRELMAKEQVA